ncbi:MAG: tetratricopeptide repeat protein [Candidatus Adiutrix sp.]|jgi:tetratricopeptide (TPR) repeat protein|nr:tetratricopeptide repeat protein [Candidatus Adiutrix sp.]
MRASSADKKGVNFFDPRLGAAIPSTQGKTITARTGQTRPAGFFSRLPVCLLGAAALLFLWLSPSPAGAQPVDPNRLISIDLDETPEFTRLNFHFQNPLEAYQLRRDDVDQLLLDLGPAGLSLSLEPPRSPLVAGVDLEEKNGRLQAVVRLTALRYEVRHQTSPDRLSLTVDIKSLDDPAGPTGAQAEEMKPLSAPTLADVARSLSLATPPQPGDGPAENLYQRILGRLMIFDYPGALDDLQFFMERFPTHPSLEPLSYLRPEVESLTGPPAETYARAVQGWQSALERWPQNAMAVRARFLLAEADRRMGYYNEAAAKFKLLVADSGGQDSVYSQLALLRAADLLMNMGLIDEARTFLDPALQEGRPDRLGLEVYARSGMADFYQGYFSQANEIFRDSLRILPGLYQTYPDLLYGMGEGYHYLDRPDLSTEYLYQALNLMPDHPKADVILARIGDNYRQEGRDREAMAVYGAASRSYPSGDGGLISQVRLADMGAIHSFFSQDKVFDILERGSRQATVEMYRKIVESGSNSPLLQLAQLKIGTAMAEDGENAEAVKWLRDLEINNPRSTLLPAALPTLAQALVEEIMLRNELNDWRTIADLYADNSAYLEGDENRVAVLRVVARAFEELGRYGEAREVWRDFEEQEPARRLARARNLVIDSLKMGQPLEALDYLLAMAREFPEQKEWMDLQMTQTGRALARPGGARATENLLTLVEATDSEPARREALADAIEIEINERRYEQAMKLMDRYRREYPGDELTPEYILTQAKIEDYEKRYDRAWDLQSEFRIGYPGDPRGPGLLKEQIARAEALGRPDDALRFMELYRLSYPQDPGSRPLLIEKMQREWDLGRYQDSQRSLAAYRRDYPLDEAIPRLLIDRSRQDWEKGRYEAAQWAVEELLENYAADPRTFDFLVGRALEDWRAERYDAAQWLVNALLRHYPQESQVGGLMLKLAADDWGRGRFEPARRGWETFRRAFPDDPRVGPSYFEQYQKSVAAGQSEAAFALAEEFRRLRPLALDGAVQADLMLEEAKDYLALGLNDQALAMWDRFRQTFPEDPRVPGLLLVQARQEIKLGQVDPALRHYREIIEDHPEDPLVPDVYLELAAAESRTGLRLPAWEDLDRYRNLFPRHAGRPKAFLDQAELGRQMGRLDEAADLYRLFRRDYPDDPQGPPTFLAQARLEISAGNSEGAIATLEEGLLSTPSLDADANVQALLTDLYLETGRVEDWAAIVERNLDRAEDSRADLEGRFLKYNQLGQVYQELGRPSDAERNFDQALENRPPGVSPETLYTLATSYKNMLRPEKYVQTLRLVLNSGDPFWQRIAEEELAQQAQQPPAGGPPGS